MLEAASWKRQLPTQVKTAIAGMSMKDQFEDITKKADDVYAAMTAGRGLPVAAAKRAHQQKPQAQEDDGDDADPEIAALRGGGRGFSRARGGRNQRGGWNRGASCGRGRGQRQPAAGATGRNNSDRHPDGPPDNACNQHFRFGRGAFFCSNPGRPGVPGCPWERDCSPPLDQNRQQ